MTVEGPPFFLRPFRNLLRSFCYLLRTFCYFLRIFCHFLRIFYHSLRIFCLPMCHLRHHRPLRPSRALLRHPRHCQSGIQGRCLFLSSSGCRIGVRHDGRALPIVIPANAGIQGLCFFFIPLDAGSGSGMTVERSQSSFPRPPLHPAPPSVIPDIFNRGSSLFAFSFFLDAGSRSGMTIGRVQPPPIVIPAKAGIQGICSSFIPLDPGSGSGMTTEAFAFPEGGSSPA